MTKLLLVAPQPPDPEPQRPLWVWLAVAPLIVSLSIAEAALKAWARPSDKGKK